MTALPASYTVSTSPVVRHLVNRMRDVSIQGTPFRRLVAEIAKILLTEAFAQETPVATTVTTWQGEGTFACFDESRYVFIPILRAALPMLEGILEIFPAATGGFLAMKRDEHTLKPTLFYDRVPDLTGRIAVLVDPMVATGGSLIDAVAVVKGKGAQRIIALNILGVHSALEAVAAVHPDIRLHIATVDDHLNADGFIVPGIGDAGDRAYNTL